MAMAMAMAMAGYHMFHRRFVRGSRSSTAGFPDRHEHRSSV